MGALDDALRYLMALRGIAIVVGVRVLGLIHEGRGDDAAGLALKLIRLARRVERGQGALDHYGHGNVLRLDGLASLVRTVRTGSLPPARLRALIETLREYETDPAALVDVLERWYVLLARGVDQVAQGELDYGWLLGDGPLASPFYLRTRFFLMPNRTKRLLAEIFRRVVQAVPLELPQAGDLRQWVYGHIGGVVAPRRVGRNHSGRLVCQMNGALAAALVAERLHADFAVRATRVFLGLRLFKDATGALPDSLGELVPGYLDGVPTDPFDGRPLRYSRTRGVIFSVGEELVDSGGSEEADLRRALEDSAQPTLILGL